jgi:hypothetical protein
VPRHRTPRSLAGLRQNGVRFLDSFTDPANHYAFATYDQSAVHQGPVTASDVLMANLLSLRLTARDVIPLFSEEDTAATRLRAAINTALDEARKLPALERCDDEEVKMPALKRANEMAREAFPNRKPNPWTSVTVSKVLHRLTRNVPLMDSRVMHFYAVKWGEDLRRELRDDIIQNHSWLANLAPSYPIHHEPMPLTRLADILIWMEGQLSAYGAPGTSDAYPRASS